MIQRKGARFGSLFLAVFFGALLGFWFGTLSDSCCPATPATLRYTSHDSRLEARVATLAPAFNPLDPATKYSHAHIFTRFPRWRGKWSPDYISDWLGVKTSTAFDCSGDYSYIVMVPSRRLPCDAHAAVSGSVKTGAAPPTIDGEMPIIDDEYPEYVDMLTAIVHAAERRPSPQTPALVVVELGARYGTWGMRALAAWRALAAPGAALFIGLDSEPRYVKWMREHAQQNGFDGAVVALEGMAAQVEACPAAAMCYDLHAVVLAAGNVSRIDFLDLDVQGAEHTFFDGADTAALMNRAVAAVHIGTHYEETQNAIATLFKPFRRIGLA